MGIFLPLPYLTGRMPVRKYSYTSQDYWKFTGIAVFQLIFLARGRVIFQGGRTKYRSNWLTAAAALRKAKGVGWGLLGKQIKD